PRQGTAHYASRPGRTSPAWAGDVVAASLLRLVGPGRRCAVLDGAVQAPLHQLRLDVRSLAREVREQLQRVLAAALRQQRGAEAVAVFAGQAAVLFDPGHGVG